MDAAGMLLQAATAGDVVSVQRALLVDGVHVDHPDAAGETALALASQNNHAAVVDTLLAFGASVVAADNDGDTALMCACWQGYEAIVDKLLAAGAIVDHVNYGGATALMCATENGHTRVVERLLAAGACVNRVDNDGDSALMCALFSGHVDVVRCLLSAGAEFHTCNNRGETPMMRAQNNGHAAIVALLRERESSLFFAAVENGRVDSVARLLPSIRVDERNTMGRTATHSAALHGRLAILKLLVDNGASIQLQDDAGWAPLHCAVSRSSDQEACVRFLLDAGALMDVVDNEGLAAVDVAARNGRLETVLVLHRHGASLQNVSRNGLTILHHAVRSRQAALVVFALNHGDASLINAADNHGWTPLHYAADADDITILSILLQRGADPNLMAIAHHNGEPEERRSTTALHMAVRRDNVDAIAVLMASGRVDTSSHNGDGETPLCLAVSLGLRSAVTMLTHLGVDNVTPNYPGESLLPPIAIHVDRGDQHSLLPSPHDTASQGQHYARQQPLDPSDHERDAHSRVVVLDRPSSSDRHNTSTHEGTDEESDPQTPSETTEGLYCQYRGGSKCSELRTTKINGTRHKLCRLHRLQQNERKRRSASKRKAAVGAIDDQGRRKRSRPSTSMQCRYAGRPCVSLRDRKPNGDLHLFCKDHRLRHNSIQRSVDQRRRGRIASSGD
jgi:uncharacterized protein